MNGCRIVGQTAKHALLLRHRPGLSAMRRARQVCRAVGGSNASPYLQQQQQHRSLQTTRPLRRNWSITPPRDPSAHPHPSPVDTPPSNLHPLSHDVRTLMRLVPHSVVVCTSTSPAKTGPHVHRPPTPRAMTMSSFTSLALTPTPVISFNIATPSRTYDAIEATRRFNIHILADDVSGTKIADWLSKGNAGGKKMFEGLVEECECKVVDGGPESEPPTLRGQGVLYVLRCRVLDEPVGGLVKVRDHVIVLGEVEEILEGEERHGKRRPHERFGLLYADRRYRQLGSCITPEKGHG